MSAGFQSYCDACSWPLTPLSALRRLSYADGMANDVPPKAVWLYSERWLAMRKRLILGLELAVFAILVATAEAGVRFSFNFNFGAPVKRHYPHFKHYSPHHQHHSPHFKHHLPHDKYHFPRFGHPRSFFTPRLYAKPYHLWIPGQWYDTPWGWRYAPGYWRSW
jgi:hypothetical protein